MDEREQVARRPALHGPHIRKRLTCGRQRAAQGGLGRDRQDEPGYQRAQISGGGQNQEPARATARQDHSGPEQHASDDAAGETAARRKLARFADVEHTPYDGELRCGDGG